MVKTMTKQILCMVFFVALAASGCLRDGYVCQDDGDCFAGETCSSGSCVATTVDQTDAGFDACVPEDEATLCAQSEPCQEDLTVTDVCGTVRTLQCDCEEVCEPETSAEICAADAIECGVYRATNRCGDEQTFMCGMCDDAEACVENACTNCVTPMCEATAECGSVANACGDTVTCGGPCESTEICLDNRCVAPVLQPDDLVPGDRFGERVVLDDDTLVVGAPGVDGELQDVGALYVYRRIGDGWIETQKIENPVPELNGRLGQVFDVEGDIIVAVSTTFLITFRQNDEGLFTFVAAQTGQPNLVSVALTEDDRVLMGAEDLDGSMITLGIAVCAEFGCEGFGNRWDTVPQPVEYGPLELGAAIASDGEYSIVGAPGDNLVSADPEEPEGTAYILADRLRHPLDSPTNWTDGLSFYERSYFNEFDSDGTTYRAGSAVAIHRDGFAAYSAPDASPIFANLEGGEYFVLAPSTQNPFTIQNRFVSPAPIAYSGCGRSLTFATPELLFVGCVARFHRGDPDVPSGALGATPGRIYSYQYGGPAEGWDLNPITLQPSSIRDFDQFGWSLDGNHEFLVVGSPGRSDDRGALFIFTPDTWIAQ